jgi:hypothetical protein
MPAQLAAFTPTSRRGPTIGAASEHNADDERRMSDCLGPFPFSALFESETIARLRLLEAAGGSAIYDADRRSDDGRRYFRAFRAA